MLKVVALVVVAHRVQWGWDQSFCGAVSFCGFIAP
jgi:hypothetical protein